MKGIILSVAPALILGTCAGAASVDDLTIDYSSGSAIIVKCDEYAEDELCIPETVNGYPIVAIGDYAFENCGNLTVVTVPEGVAQIGNGAFFNCYNLDFLQLPESVTRIGVEAFRGCEVLNYVNLPPELECVGDGTFYGCAKLGKIALPGGISAVGDKAFKDCLSLESVVLPDGLTSLGDETFENCKALAGVTIPGRVTAVGAKTFAGCEMLKSVDLPGGIASIGKGAFDGCTSLKRISFGGGVSDWRAISVGEGNDVLQRAAVDFAVAEDYVTVEKTEICSDEEGIDFEYAVQAIGGLDLNGTFYLAAYTSGGRLLGVFSQEVSGVGTDFSIAASMETDEEPGYFKAFFWGGESGIVPLAKDVARDYAD